MLSGSVVPIGVSCQFLLIPLKLLSSPGLGLLNLLWSSNSAQEQLLQGSLNIWLLRGFHQVHNLSPKAGEPIQGPVISGSISCP